MNANAQDLYSAEVAGLARSASLAVAASSVTMGEHDDEILLPAIDEMVAEGRYQYLRTFEMITGQDPVERLMRVVKCMQGDAEAMNQLTHVINVNHALLAAMARIYESGVLGDPKPVHHEPCAWLAEWPVALAELRLAAERGVAAAAIIGSAAANGDQFNQAQSHELINLWLAGSTAALRLVASFWPDFVSPEVVALEVRVDMDEAMAEQQRWKAFVTERMNESTDSLDV